MAKYLNITAIKAIHSIIWIIMASAVFYILYCGIFDIANTFLYLSIGLIAAEIVVLLIFSWSCPLTIVAKRIKTDWKDGDDIFLPTWVAIHNKTIFGFLLTLGICLLLIRAFGFI